ncbi:MAG: crotonase/enoyl-CoA hydratase family protein [Streptosporangiales bacterium]|nr:crotonase/enoyl-CoA hydratase family protein [Streptosporangiales bacterium]
MPGDQVTYELDGDIALIGINRPGKRNAMSETLMAEIGDLAEQAGQEARAGVLFGNGPHFSAGLDLADLAQRLKANGGRRAPYMGKHAPHVAFDKIARGRIPFVSALSGAVIGAGLEIASATHVRVADDTAFFALPEAQRGIFVGAGGSVRIQRLIGNARMMDMMLTGRVLSPDEALAQNLVQYRVGPGEALKKARELAGAMAGNTPEGNWAIINGLGRINEMSHDDALFMEALVSRNAASGQARGRLDDFLNKKAKPIGPAGLNGGKA